MSGSPPFHRGEIAAQRRYGKDERMQRVGSVVIRDFMPPQHRAFFDQLPMLFYAALDSDGRPWASVLTGVPGFVRSPNERQLQISAASVPGDPIRRALQSGADIGLLGIEFHTRRRNRLNGVITDASSNNIGIEVRQSFGNCPKYIQARTPGPVPAPHGTPMVTHSLTLLPSQVRQVRNADTFFIASHFSEGKGLANEGVDISHRGGLPGFVTVADNKRLTWPDYSGNFHFNTIGNLVLNPKSGLLFVDFDSGDLLLLSGSASVTWDGDDVKSIAGAERLLHFDIEQVVAVARGLPFSWSAAEFSRFLDGTGTRDHAGVRVEPD